MCYIGSFCIIFGLKVAIAISLSLGYLFFKIYFKLKIVVNRARENSSVTLSAWQARGLEFDH